MNGKALSINDAAVNTPFEAPARPYPSLVQPVSMRHPLLDAFEQAQYGQLMLHAPDDQTYLFGCRAPGTRQNTWL